MSLTLKYSVAFAALVASPVPLFAQEDGTLASTAATKANERRAEIQKQLADGSEVLRRFRADSFVADGPRIKIVGVFLEFGFAPTREADPKAPFETLQDELREVIRAAVKDVTNNKQLLFDFSGVLRLEKDDALFPRLQEEIAARPALDGVRVDAKATFGPRGELRPAGIRPKAADKMEREAVERAFASCYRAVLDELTATRDAAANRYKKLAVGNVATTNGMTEADTRKILELLREWARNSKDDIRFARLFFGPDGGLKLLCETPTEEDLTEVRGKFKEFAPDYFPKKRGDDSPPAHAVESGTIPSFMPFLQQQLADDPKKRWAAVIIERGYFDSTNRYVLRGLIDRKEQRTELTKLVAEFEADPKWKTYFSRDVRLALDVIAMEELVERLQRVLPAYPLFDGIAIVKAAYDKERNLVFSATVVGKPKLNDARLQLAELLAKHPGYSRRVTRSADAREPNVRIEPLMSEPVPPDEVRADQITGNAIAALAKGEPETARKWIESGILHHPNDPTAWFASAYYHHLKDDKELVRRDLFRMIAIEGGLDSFQRKRRYEAAKDLQGRNRDELEKLSLEYWKEAKDGAKPITLVPAK